MTINKLVDWYYEYHAVSAEASMSVVNEWLNDAR